MALGRDYFTEIDKSEANTSTTDLHMKAICWMWTSFLVGLISGTPGRTGAIPAGARWTVYGSSDGVTANVSDGNARGLVAAVFDPTKWVRAAGGVAHSWIVLTKTIGADTFYLLIDLGTGADTTFNVRVTKSAPTGGSITTIPTTTAEVIRVNFVAISAVGAAGGVRGWITTDEVGHFWFGVKQAGEDIGLAATLVASFWDVDDPHEDDQNPWAFYLHQNGSIGPLNCTEAANVSASAGSTAAWGGRSKTGAGVVHMYMGTIGGVSGPFEILAGGEDFIRNNNPAQPTVDLWILTAGQSGRRGSLPDVQVGTPKGDGYSNPNAAAVERVLIGYFWLPMMAIPSVS